MSTSNNPRSAGASAESPRSAFAPTEDLPSTATTTDDWTPEDRPPSTAENNFLSFALFGFLILFGVSCFVVF
ncbi:hypothetical protein GCM10022261_01050 [Brevibacterium daeguense]|uniref:Uncharacterized protein n=1 Tax=Brevibacterium daeguense TaxID=909936 RepID=A0ABP8EF85_9MICO|nr:hypothetical protein [Brevibacterium daeguense]